MTTAGWLVLPDGSQVRHSAITRVYTRGEFAEAIVAWQALANVTGFSAPLALSATPFVTEAEARAFIDALLPTIPPMVTP